jgi:hypothetical protein
VEVVGKGKVRRMWSVWLCEEGSDEFFLCRK